MSTINLTGRTLIGGSIDTSILSEMVAKNSNITEEVAKSLFEDETKNGINEEEIVLLNKATDVALGQEAFNGNISINTDRTSTFQENIDASSEFFSTYDNLQEVIKNSNTDLTKVQETKVDKLSQLSEKLNSGEYVLTKDIKDAINTANKIIESSTGNEQKSEEKTKNNGLSILSSLKSIISKDKDAKEDTNDNVLTQKEYDNLKCIFTNADNTSLASSNLSIKAQQYGIYIAA